MRFLSVLDPDGLERTWSGTDGPNSAQVVCEAVDWEVQLLGAVQCRVKGLFFNRNTRKYRKKTP